MSNFTPVRPVPGAFMHTPAVASRFGSSNDTVSRRLFPPASAPSGGSSGALAGPATSTAPASSTQETTPLAKAASYINTALAKDEAFPELDTYCRQVSSEYDVSAFDSAWAPFQKTQMYEIPQVVFDHFNRAQVATNMGLFAELNHAWVAIDSSLFLWDYTHPNPELIGYEDNPHSINAVQLVAPKPGVFMKHINYMLVVATSQDIFLLAVAAEPTPSGGKKLELYNTKISTQIRDMSVIAGAANGRIFFAGNASDDVYELYYQQEERWFSGKSGRINHTAAGWSSVVPSYAQTLWQPKDREYIIDIVVDDTRNLVYSLSSTSTVRTYYMEAPDKLTKVIEKTKNDCLRDIAHLLSGASPLLNDRMNIVSISPITAPEGSKLHLMALTNTGCRLFLSATNASSYMLRPSTNQAPQSMALHSIKFPPSQASAQRRATSDPYDTAELLDVQSPLLNGSQKGVRYAPGYFLDFVPDVERPENNRCFLSAPDTGRIKHANQTQALRYYEQCHWIELGSKAVDIGLITKPFSATSAPLGFGNELAVQFDAPPSEFAVFTNTGVHVIRRRRLVDIFAAVMRTAAGDEGLKAEFNKFQTLYGRVETINAALAVACGHGNDFRIGGGRGAVDQLTEDRARQTFVNFGGNPTLPERDGLPLAVESVRPSSRHGALTYYIARLVRSLWRAPVIRLGTIPANGALTVGSTIPTTKLVSVQENLERLKAFLETNRSLIQGLTGPSSLMKAGSKAEELALQGEHQAMNSLQVLMSGISEGISFVLMLFDERVTDIFLQLDENSKRQLRELTYERLFSQPAGKDIAKLLVKAIVNRNIESGSNVETVADALRRRCGSFCSPQDVIIFRAQELLKKASDKDLVANASRTLLHDSLRLFSHVAGHLTQANLEGTVAAYIELRYYAGAIELCLTVANEKDRGNVALSWVNEGKPPGDKRGLAFEDRRKCYNLIHDVLQQLDAASAMEPELIDGRPTLIATKRAEAYDVVNGSTDEVFHFDLYEWYISQGWTDRILAIESPHVITFLQRLATTDVQHADLLCRFYTMRNRFYEAAKVQYELAQSEFDIPIKERLRLLSRAKTNASVMTVGVGRQELQMLNHEIAELLEVAHIQDDLLERLRVDFRIPREKFPEIEQALDGRVRGLSELFNSYADQAGYYDLCLLIYHAADFRNPTTIQQTWHSLIEQNHEEIAAAWQDYDSRPHPANNDESDAPAQPYETLVTKIQDVCHRTGNDDFIFPVTTLLPEVCKYALENSQDARIGADPNWTVVLFLGLGVSHDTMLRILERMFETQEIPFRGAGRIRVVEWLVYVVTAWTKEMGRSGRPEVRIEGWVADLLAEADKWLSSVARTENLGGRPTQEVNRAVRDVRRNLETLASSGGFRSSMGFL